MADRFSSAGWLSLRNWYCEALHKSSNSDGARWVVVNSSDDPLLDEFMIEWDKDVHLGALDLLLIGTKEHEEYEWQMAALSNLQFSRPECTVEVITEKMKLDRIASAVLDLSGPRALKCGRWKEFPGDGK